jgi:ATP-dependent RNA helicase RhlB
MKAATCFLQVALPPQNTYLMKKVIKKVASWLGKLRGKKSKAAEIAKPHEEKKPHSSSHKERHRPPTEHARGSRADQHRKRQGNRHQPRHGRPEGEGFRRTDDGAQRERRTPSTPHKGAPPSSHRGAERTERRPQRSRWDDRKPKPVHRAEPEVPQAPIEDNWSDAQFVVAPEPGRSRFHDLNLPKPIMHAIADLNFQYCTPIQAGVLPKSLVGRDVIGQAQTGTGKSAAFLITILAHLLKNPADPQRRRGTPRALILAPTRELVMQIEKDAKLLSKYMAGRIVSVFGGMHYEKQKHWLDALVDIVVATPGRLIDFKSQGVIHLGHVEILVIDEADRMLDMGFIPDIRNIVQSTPAKEKRQTLFFSATVTEDVMRLAGHWTRDAHKEAIEAENIAVNTIDQKIYITTTDEKFALLYNMITQQNLERVIVFCNRRDETQKLYEGLLGRGVSCGLLSGDVDQRKRIRTLEELRNSVIRVLVATDVAARGLHIEGVSHVVNYNLPLDPEDYVHRIGRTGRAGALGTSVSFACEEDGTQIPVIEEFIGRKLEYVYPPDEWLTAAPVPTVEIPKSAPHERKRFDNRGRSNRGPRRGNSRRPPRRDGGRHGSSGAA